MVKIGSGEMVRDPSEGTLAIETGATKDAAALM